MNAAPSVLGTSALSHSLPWGQSKQRHLYPVFTQSVTCSTVLQACPCFPCLYASAEGVTLPASLCPRPSVSVESQPALDLQHYRDSHSGPLQYIFWRQMLRSICPGEHLAGRDGCGGTGMLCTGSVQLVKCHP